MMKLRQQILNVSSSFLPQSSLIKTYVMKNITVPLSLGAVQTFAVLVFISRSRAKMYVCHPKNTLNALHDEISCHLQERNLHNQRTFHLHYLLDFIHFT